MAGPPGEERSDSRERREQGEPGERSLPDLQPLDAQLLDRRVVRLWGLLDDATVARACAEMMALDATGDGAVQLYVGSAGGPVHSAMSLIDTMDLLGVPVHVTCLGRAEGAAVGVVAAGVHRVAAPHAQFRLSEPEVSVSGNASQLAAWAEHHRVELGRFVKRLAQATGRPEEHLEADLSLGRWLDAEEAVSYGLVDEVWGSTRGPLPRSAGPRPAGPRRPFGFGPKH